MAIHSGTALQKVIGILDAQQQAARMAGACRLARDGRWREAEAFLCRGSGWPADAASLDILARLYVGQGRFGAARAAWLRAKGYGRRHEKIERLLGELDRYEDALQVARSRRVLAGIVIVILAACLTAAAVGFGSIQH